MLNIDSLFSDRIGGKDFIKINSIKNDRKEYSDLNVLDFTKEKFNKTDKGIIDALCEDVKKEDPLKAPISNGLTSVALASLT